MSQAGHEPNQPRVIAFDDTEGFDRGDFQGQIYVGKDEELGFSALAIFVDGRHPRKRMGETTTRTYLVVEGEGAFQFGKQRAYPVKRGDFVFIPPESDYAYLGNMLLWEMNVSPDNSFKDQKLD